MPLYEKIIETISTGQSFSANHNGITVFTPIEVLPIDCPRTDKAMIGYFIQAWAAASIYRENSIISFIVGDDKVKIYY